MRIHNIQSVAKGIHMAKKPVKRLGIKEVHRKKLITHLANPDNEWPKRSDWLSKILGMKTGYRYMYRMFKAEELDQIEIDALTLRRKKYAPMLADVDKALIKNAQENGRAAEVSLVYKRFEGWQERSTTEVTHTLRLDKELQELLNPVYKRGAITVEPERTAGLLSETI